MKFLKMYLISLCICLLIGFSFSSAISAPLGQNTVLKCVEYRWGEPAPGYSYDDLPIFESWMNVRIENPCPEDVFNVTATLSGWPENCVIVDGKIIVGNIPGGSSAWSKDSFTIRVDMEHPVDPNEGVLWTIEYDDADGMHHVIQGVPEFPIPDDVPPTVAVSVASTSVNVGEAVNITVAAEDNVGLCLLVLEVDGEEIPYDTEGSATYVPMEEKEYNVLATATDADGNISEATATFVAGPLQISIEAGLDTMNIDVGDSDYVAFTISFQTEGADTYHVIAEQTVSPVGGITWTNDYPSGGWTTNSSITWVINEQISGNVAGTYELKKTVTILETGGQAEATIIVNVLSGIEEPQLLPLGSVPDGVNTSVPTEVTFTTMITDSEVLPSQVILERLDAEGNVIDVLGQLVDDETNGDLAAGDLVYSGTFMVNEDTEGAAYIKAEATFPGIGTVSSQIYPLVVTRFPIELKPSDMSKVVLDPNTGEEFLSNEVLVTFVEGTIPDTIEAIITSINGTIVGTIPGLGIYQVKIPDTGDETGVNNAINVLSIHPEVVSAEANGIPQLGQVVPSDTKYTSQWAPQKIRADEAWVIARGSVTVAVVDTGVDYNHEDLSGKVIKGKDVADNNNDPMDGGTYKSHGTHVAGIIAAKTNNGKGIAGISWGSKILAVKVYKDSGGGGTWAIHAAGVKYAADKGAKIINYSNWSNSGSTTIHSAVKHATQKGALFVAIAGNAGSSTKTYPGGYPESFTVGNTTSADGRASTSNYGSWVDIAAPGSDILSTVPDNKYANKSGTSMAAPHVAGAAAVVWSRHPSWSASKVRQRLEKTAKELAGLQLGHGRIDLFEAVFNGSFEIGDLSEWSSVGTTSSITALGPIKPQHRKHMGYASTGPSGDFVAATLSQSFKIQPGVTTLPITFDYTFVTEEYPEWVGTIYDDAVTITLMTPSGSIHTLAVERVNSSSFTPIGGIDFPGGDNTVGWTGWKTAHKDIPVTEGSGTYKIFIRDAGDDIYDSAILIDNIKFK